MFLTLVLMLKIKFCNLSDGRVVGFHILGHCGYAENGRDIVCAAVSSAAYLVINTITDVLRINPRVLNVSDGNAEFVVEESDELQCRSLLNGLREHFLGLEQLYPKNVQVDYMEV